MLRSLRFLQTVVLQPYTTQRYRLRKWPLPALDTGLPHRLTFEAAKIALGKPAANLTDYFDACRRKRNEIDYTGAAITTTTEAEELLLHANAFLKLVEDWIEATYPTFSK
jgi:hypothetical protein